jgi:hypothetical protein
MDWGKSTPSLRTFWKFLGILACKRRGLNSFTLIRVWAGARKLMLVLFE